MATEPITASNNITFDMTRTDREYLVTIGHFDWIVNLTDEAESQLSNRLSKLVSRGLITVSEPAWSITCLSAIREHRHDFTMEQYLAHFYKESE